MKTSVPARMTRWALAALLTTTAALGVAWAVQARERHGPMRSPPPRAPATTAGTPSAHSATTPATRATPTTAVTPPRFSLSACPASATTTHTTQQYAGDPRARAAAQRSLAFLAREATAFQQAHNCYGCHVQAVTLEAMVVGRSHQYTVDQTDLDTALRGMLSVAGGARTPGGLRYANGDTLVPPSRAFGGAAFAHYDERLGSAVREDLLQVAGQLLEYQQANGSVGVSYVNPPVATGDLQATTLAIQTWRQAHARTADERWLPPIRRAEAFLQTQAAELAQQHSTALQLVNYAIIGLASAGAQGAEGVMRELATLLRRQQQDDGGWRLTDGAAESAFATGQTLHALRLLGIGDADPTIARGTAWLVAHQAENGGWSQGGSSRAEAMWGVLGLVAIDVLSVAVEGVTDGEHLRAESAVRVTARDNQGGNVQRVDLLLDDVPIHGACGAALEYRLAASGLAAGVHTLEAVATNANGQSSRRRMEVYAGAYYLTQAGTRFADNGTMISLRDVAPSDLAHRVVLRIFATRQSEGRTVRDAEVHRVAQAGAQGPVSFFWNGNNASGTALPRGRYIAEIAAVDARDATVQTVELPFVHDTAEVQRATYGEVEGQLGVAGAGAATNTRVDLVDGRGNVVQSVETTRAGQYRFRNVEGGNYQVRVRRSGFQNAEMPVVAAPAASHRATDIQLHQN